MTKDEFKSLMFNLEVYVSRRIEILDSANKSLVEHELNRMITFTAESIDPEGNFR